MKTNLESILEGVITNRQFSLINSLTYTFLFLLVNRAHVMDDFIIFADI